MYTFANRGENENSGLLHAVVISLQSITHDDFKEHITSNDLNTPSALRKQLVLEASSFEYVYSSYFKVIRTSYHKWKQDLLDGIVEAEKYLLPVLSNILQVPVILLTDLDSFPIISIIPTRQSAQINPECMLFIAYEHKHKRFSGLVPQHKPTSVPTSLADTTQCITEGTKKTSCRCGRGRKRGEEEDFTSCDSYSKRCPCFQAFNGCGSDCECIRCENFRGKSSSRTSSTTIGAPRKRQKTQMQEILIAGQSRCTVINQSISALDVRSLNMSVINFFLWNGITIDEGLIRSVTEKILDTLKDVTYTKEQIHRLTKNMLHSLDSCASLLVSKMQL